MAFEAKTNKVNKNLERSGPFLNKKDLGAFGTLLLWLFSETRTKRQVIMMITSIKNLTAKNGTVFAVLYLKEAHRLFMKSLAGQPEKCETLIRVATRRGLPLIIPGSLRLLIESGDLVSIRLVGSILSIYRVLKVKANLKINTITDVFTGSSQTLPDWEVALALRWMKAKLKFVISKEADILPLNSAGPNSKISVLGSPLDAWAFKENPDLLSAFRTLAKTLGNSLDKLLQQEIDNLPNWFAYLKPEQKSLMRDRLKLGKLSEKIEAAGKVRLFAIADVWTQSLLKPLHDALFNCLRSLPTDGTFDQLAPIRRLFDKGLTKLYSFDLTAATDRLPIELQKQVLSCLISREFADAWATLLVGRPWYHKFVPYYYSVGQPMGALSSWAMLSMTHHLMVQVAARRVGWTTFFDDYAILGDDLVIGHPDVASSYLIIAKDLGVEINQNKSLISTIGVAEFAKRLIYSGTDLSPVPPRLIVRLIRNIRNLPSVVREMVDRGMLSQATLLIKDKTIKSRVLWEMIGPLGFLDREVLSPSFQKDDRELSRLELQDYCLAIRRVVNRKLTSLFFQRQNSTTMAISKLTTLVYDGLIPKLPGSVESYVKESLRKHPEDESEIYWAGFMLPEDIAWEEFKWNLDTPALQRVVQNTIEEVQRLNSSPPELLPEFEGELNPLNVSTYLRKGVDALDDFILAVPDLTIREDPKDQVSRRMEFYRELEAEMDRLF
jgi:hypothetical protein